MIKLVSILILGMSAIAFGLAYTQGLIPKETVEGISSKAFAMLDTKGKKPDIGSDGKDVTSNAPAITVARVTKADFVEHVLVTGSIVAREQIMITPEVEGLRVLSYEVEEGDYVKKGQLLASLERTTLTSSLEQNTAAIERADAAIAQAQSQIQETKAVLKEAQAALKRAEPLTKAGHVSKSIYDQREAAALSALARLKSARAGLALAQADKSQLKAQRLETTWRLSRSEIKSPVDGLISRRRVRIGDLASRTKPPMFEIVQDGILELEAEVDAYNLAKLKKGQTAAIQTATEKNVSGTVRLVSPQINAATRLGRALILLESNPELKVGAFARGYIETAQATGLSIPSTAILYNGNRATVLRVENNTVQTTPIKVGLRDGNHVEVLEGLKLGDLVVAKAGTFLRDGDRIRPLESKRISREVQE